MKKHILSLITVYAVLGIFSSSIHAQNPVIRDQFSADPSARVFNGKVYVYPSHDILSDENRGRIGWFCMEDYHVFSSSNLTDWTDHGMIVSQYSAPWVDTSSYSMWAPDCIEKDGKYYFYFPATPKDAPNGRGFGIGVAVADKPEGPFIPQPEKIKGIIGIDPNPFIDSDGQAYLYWSLGKLYVAKLKDNMLELESEPEEIKYMPEKGLKEGPYMFERNGIYYMTYPHVENNIERLEYATGDNPEGPFRFAGVIMDESPMGCWTNHQSIIQFNGQWYLFYHQNDFSPQFDKNRSVRIDSLFFNEDGTIRKVIPTMRGVGISPAMQKIEIDRYSEKSETGIEIDFLDSLDTFKGWKVLFLEKESWIRYNAVDFGNGKLKYMAAEILAPTGGKLEIRQDNINGTLLADLNIKAQDNWQNIKAKVGECKSGTHDLFIILKSDGAVETDWIRFLK